MTCIKSKHNNNINSIRIKDRIHPLLLLLFKDKLNNIIPTRVQIRTSQKFLS